MSKLLTEFTEIFNEIILEFEDRVLIWNASQGDTDNELTDFINTLLKKQSVIALRKGNKPLAIFIKDWLSGEIEYSYFRGLNTLMYNLERYKVGVFYIPCPAFIEHLSSLYKIRINRNQHPVLPDNMTEETKQLIKESCFPSQIENIYKLFNY